MFQKHWLLIILLCTLGLTGCHLNKPPAFNGIPIAELYEAMPATSVVLLNGHYEHDVRYFYQAYPWYLALKADAVAEGTSVVFVRADNYYRDQASIVKTLGVKEYWRFLAKSNVRARTSQTERNLEIGFCKDPAMVDTGYNYFYCFGYGGSIYRVVTKVDTMDRESGRIKRAWVYMPYKTGDFKDFFVPGPYGILPKPAVTGRFYEPRVFID